MQKNNKIINLGCRLNIYEGEVIQNHIIKQNLKNVTVINSCAVTAEAEKKVLYEIRRAKKNKPKNNKIAKASETCIVFDNDCKIFTIIIIYTII